MTFYNVTIMNAKPNPTDIEACHRLIATLQTQVEDRQQAIQAKQQAFQEQAIELSLKDKLIEEQAHSVLELKADHDKFGEKVTELKLTIEKLLKQLYGRERTMRR